MIKTVKHCLVYDKENHGRRYRIRIEKGDECPRIYYWWEEQNIPEDTLNLPVKLASVRWYSESHGKERELEIVLC